MGSQLDSVPGLALPVNFEEHGTWGRRENIPHSQWPKLWKVGFGQVQQKNILRFQKKRKKERNYAIED